MGVKVNNGITGLHLGLKYFIGRHGSLQYWIMITAIKYINLAKKEVQKRRGGNTDNMLSGCMNIIEQGVRWLGLGLAAKKKGSGKLCTFTLLGGVGARPSSAELR